REDREAILRELQEVLASPHFSNSKRYPALLQYIVENTLAGKSDLLKERTLGVEVFDRPPTYDTNTDTVVRYTAGEVRKRLSLYYLERGGSSSIRISLPPGSYIPEFLQGQEESSETDNSSDPSGTPIADAHLAAEPATEIRRPHPNSLLAVPVPSPRPATAVAVSPSAASGKIKPIAFRLLWLTFAAMLVIAAIEGLRWKYHSTLPQTAVDEFWGPVLREQRMVLICTGSVVFAPDRFSGTLTAGKDIEYPFVSMEGASAISLVSGLLQSSGAPTQLKSAGSTPLTELREHSSILLGGFNNQWTLRLTEPLRFHFAADPAETIVDQLHPQVRWTRDPSLPYSSAGDYALLARYRDTTTDSWVVVLAGVGRNGTEAAAEFATSPHYMQLLRDQLGSGFSDKNVEAVLKVSVIDGKTGAPSIMAVHIW
ncbi:MAG: hypothetical protein WBQ94_16895, partial [Terracidiphilus sp.]